MVKLTREKAATINDVETVSKQEKIEEESIVVLQRLMSEEANLIEEKKNLSSLREKLRSKVQEEIESKKNRIQQLRVEIINLKSSCGELSNSLKAGAKK